MSNNSNAKQVIVQEAFIAENFKGENNEEKTNWIRVGVVFQHKNGDGFNLVIPKGMSLSGTVQLFPKKEKSDK